MNLNRNFMGRAGLAVMAIGAMFGSQQSPTMNPSRTCATAASIRPSRRATGTGRPVPVRVSELQNVQRQQERKAAGADRSRLRVLRYGFRAVAGMKVRKVGIPLFDQDA